MNGANGWSAVLFDLDGTLADTIELIVRCFRHTMSEHLGEVPPDERWLETIGIPLREQLAAFAADGEEVARMAETYVARQHELHDDLVAPYAGAVDLLRRLAAGGTPIGVVTSKRSGMARRTLERCGFGSMYDVLVAADQVERPKPNPEPVALALQRLGVADPEGALFVGDAPFDIAAGRQAGVHTAAALWGPHPRERLAREQPTFYVETIREVADLRRPAS